MSKSPDAYPASPRTGSTQRSLLWTIRGWGTKLVFRHRDLVKVPTAEEAKLKKLQGGAEKINSVN